VSPAEGRFREVSRRGGAVQTLLKFAESNDVSNRKAAVLAVAYLAQHAEVRPAIDVILKKLADEQERS
jgi:hypothetical protein